MPACTGSRTHGADSPIVEVEVLATLDNRNLRLITVNTTKDSSLVCFSRNEPKFFVCGATTLVIYELDLRFKRIVLRWWLTRS